MTKREQDTGRGTRNERDGRSRFPPRAPFNEGRPGAAGVKGGGTAFPDTRQALIGSQLSAERKAVSPMPQPKELSRETRDIRGNRSSRPLQERALKLQSRDISPQAYLFSPQAPPLPSPSRGASSLAPPTMFSPSLERWEELADERTAEKKGSECNGAIPARDGRRCEGSSSLTQRLEPRHWLSAGEKVRKQKVKCLHQLSLHDLCRFRKDKAHCKVMNHLLGVGQLPAAAARLLSRALDVDRDRFIKRFGQFEARRVSMIQRTSRRSRTWDPSRAQ